MFQVGGTAFFGLFDVGFGLKKSKGQSFVLKKTVLGGHLAELPEVSDEVKLWQSSGPNFGPLTKTDNKGRPGPQSPDVCYWF